MGSDFLLQCSNCGTSNRVPAQRFAEHANCGKCKAPLISSHCMPATVTDKLWDSEVIASQVPVMVVMWSPHCGVCDQYELSVQRMAGRFCGAVRLLKMNVEENPIIPARYSLRGVPSVLLFRDGKLVRMLVGPQGERGIREVLGMA